ncbi:MAG: SEC-C domain-containing protein [Candidatus Eisenbacteria sp.]|nr:SEC-C domain-containing protein [Candidatus Eisenbacteria bacterium]
MAKAGRNAPCPCGSGKKYKKCCLQKDQERSPLMSTTWPPSAGHNPAETTTETLDGWMREGYALMMDGLGAQACDRWSTVWEIIRSRFDPEMRTCRRTAVVFDATQPLYDWVQDFALELYNAALDDVRYAEIGIGLCQEVLAQFPDEDELFHLNFRADLGQFYYLARRAKEGERTLLDLIHDYPDRAAGYARFADILAYGARPDDPPSDPQRAEELFETAIARPVSDATRYDLQNRLDELRNSRQCAGGKHP